MSRKEDKKAPLSQSFVTGVIAAVFLIVGYQTAAFIHRAAVVKIAADRDVPDTVYVYMAPENDSGSQDASPVKVERRNSSHSGRAEAVRKNVPYPRVESFTFDPNTVSVEDLARLGFSMKQAQAIDRYRRNGGRFRRKTDFAESYVVSDSIYSRLEPFIEIPLVDLNKADSAAFDALPGIGGWYASRMVQHRTALGGYSRKEQLMDIYRFDREKYDALSDLITVERPYFYPLWELAADSLRRHPYINNYETARAIVLFREHSPKEDWTVENLASAGIISDETALRLGRCVRND